MHGANEILALCAGRRAVTDFRLAAALVAVVLVTVFDQGTDDTFGAVPSVAPTSGLDPLNAQTYWSDFCDEFVCRPVRYHISKIHALNYTGRGLSREFSLRRLARHDIASPL
jgi:hypothetical protein